MKTKQSILTELPPPRPSQQRAAPLTGSHRFQRRRKNLISLSQQSSSGGSSFPSAPYLCLWGGRTDCGCLQLAAAGTSLVGPHGTTPETLRGLVSAAVHPPRRGKSSRSDSLLLQLPGLCFAFSVFQSLDLAFTFLAHQSPYTQLMCSFKNIFLEVFVFGRLSHAKTFRTDCVHGFGTHIRQRSVN